MKSKKTEFCKHTSANGAICGWCMNLPENRAIVEAVAKAVLGSRC